MEGQSWRTEDFNLDMRTESIRMNIDSENDENYKQEKRFS